MKGVWKLGIGVVALIALAAATVGFVGAQTDGDGNGPLGTFVSKLAANLGISEDELNTALDKTQLEMVDEALADGRITDDQAANARDRINSGEPFFGPLLGHGPRMHGARFAIGMHALDSYAGAAGITKAELVDAWQGDGTLGDVLTGLGVDTDAVTAQIVADVEARLTENGVDQARIDEAVTHTTENLGQLLASEDPPERCTDGFGRFPGAFPEGDNMDTTEAVFPTF